MAAWAGGLPRERVLVAAVLAVFVLNLAVNVAVPYATYVLVTQPEWEAAGDATPCETTPDGTEVCPPPPLPPTMVWDAILDEYRLDATFALGGAYLVLAPLAWVAQGGVLWFPWQPFVWLAATASVPAAAWYGRGLSRWRLVPYAALIALQLSGFGAYYWSTLGD